MRREAATICFYKSKLRFLLASKLAAKRLDEIEEEMIQDYIESRRCSRTRRNTALSPASVNRELATLRRMLRLAYRWKIISRLPVITLLRGEKHRETILTRGQEPLYLATAPEPLRTVAAFLIDAGLRMGEMLTLERPDVHLDAVGGAVFGYLTVPSGKAKNSKTRNVPLTARVTEILNGFGPKQGGFVFCRADGTALAQTYINEQARDLRRRLNLPPDLTPHAFRHTFGTRLGESGADAFTMMKLMGHSSVTVSQRYVHPPPESVERAFARFEALQLNGKQGMGIESGIAGLAFAQVAAQPS